MFLRTSACVCRTSENCKSLVLQDKYNMEIFFCSGRHPESKVSSLAFNSAFSVHLKACIKTVFIKMTFHLLLWAGYRHNSGDNMITTS